MIPTTSQPSLYDTLAGLVRLVLVVMAVPAVMAGAAVACAVLVLGAPVVLGSRFLRQLKKAASSPTWAAPNAI
ncbi:MAG: hypothetical protein RL375_3691 [Pseudomonadota bacterium]|jgi:hypothetical protein